MKPKRFFSSESAHGSESSHGFANDTIVLVFSTREARDCYVLGRSIGTSRQGRNLSCQAIRASEATRAAAKIGVPGLREPVRQLPYSNECWIIRELDDPESVPGCIGALEIGSTWDDSVTRFYR